MVVVFYITSHGFGHATRDLEIIRHIQQQRPGTRIVVRTAVPRWFLDRASGGTIDIHSVETDTGIAQIDSLQLDEAETARRALAFYRTFDARIDAEAAVLKELHASVVVGDVPPLAFAAAHRANVPSIAVANFTWDWIYAGYQRFSSDAPGVMTTIRDAYSQTTLALRLPFAGGFETMQAIRDVPLVARRSRRTREDNRRLLDLDHARPVVLASFGGHHTVIPFEKIARTHDMTLVLTDYEADYQSSEGFDGRLRRLTSAMLEHADIRYEDLVAAADVVVSKPGYGIVSECIANQTALLYTSRGVFAENDVLLAGMQPVVRSQFIAQDDLRSGRWETAIRALLDQPPPKEVIAINGAEKAAAAILGSG